MTGVDAAVQAWWAAVDACAAEHLDQDVDVLLARTVLGSLAAAGAVDLPAAVALHGLRFDVDDTVSDVSRRAGALALLGDLVPAAHRTGLEQLLLVVAALSTPAAGEQADAEAAVHRALAHLEAADALVEQDGGDGLAPAADVVWGWALLCTGEEEAAEECLEAASTAASSPRHTALAMFLAGTGHASVARHGPAARWFRRAAATAEEAGDRDEALRCWASAVDAGTDAAAEAAAVGYLPGRRTELAAVLEDLAQLRAGRAGPAPVDVVLKSAAVAQYLATVAVDLGDRVLAESSFQRALQDALEARRPDRAIEVHQVWGTTLLKVGDLAAARVHLEIALAGLTGRPDQERACRSALAALDVAEGRRPGNRPGRLRAAGSPDPVARTADWVDLVLRGVDALATGDLGAAEQVAVEMAAADPDLGAVTGPLLVVQVALAVGRTTAVTRALGDLTALEGTAATPGYRAAIAAVRGRVLLAEGDRPRGLRELRRARRLALALGNGPVAAWLAVDIAAKMLLDGDATGAAALAVPAVLALDAHRFTLASAERRRAYAQTVSEAAAVAYRAAAHADGALLAELMEALRASGLPVAVPGGPAPVPAELALLLATEGGGLPVAAPVAVDARFLLAPEENTVLAVPPLVEMPWGGACRAQLAAAQEYGRPGAVAAVRLVVPGGRGRERDAGRTGGGSLGRA